MKIAEILAAIAAEQAAVEAAEAAALEALMHESALVITRALRWNTARIMRQRLAALRQVVAV